MSGLGRPLAAGAAGLALLVVLAAAAAGGALGGLLGGTGAATAPSADALSNVPAAYLALYQRAAATCPGLSWTVLAAIGTVESDNGQSTLPGVSAGQNASGAMGPLQMLGATFAAYDTPVPPGGANPPSPYDPTDAAYAAARMLCADGGRNDANLTQAVWDYNHSQSYVTEVLGLAARYGQTATTAPPSAAATTALAYALSQRGTPYRWGGESPGVGFDCSGLTQAAYAAAGITLPRVAQAQYDAGPHVPPGQVLEPGDLVFFGSSTSDVTHVGIVVNPAGEMIDAPHTGAQVRIEAFPTTIDAPWGTDLYLGATRPVA
ncbi:MAG: C40 family peptidase [Acidimicrobiales bacterium]